MKRVLLLISRYHVWMYDSPSSYFDCAASAVAEQCGEEIGSHITQLGQTILQECVVPQKWQRGKPQNFLEA